MQLLRYNLRIRTFPRNVATQATRVHKQLLMAWVACRWRGASERYMFWQLPGGHQKQWKLLNSMANIADWQLLGCRDVGLMSCLGRVCISNSSQRAAEMDTALECRQTSNSFAQATLSSLGEKWPELPESKADIRRCKLNDPPPH